MNTIAYSLLFMPIPPLSFSLTCSSSSSIIFHTFLYPLPYHEPSSLVMDSKILFASLLIFIAAQFSSSSTSSTSKYLGTYNFTKGSLSGYVYFKQELGGYNYSIELMKEHKHYPFYKDGVIRDDEDRLDPGQQGRIALEHGKTIKNVIYLILVFNLPDESDQGNYSALILESSNRGSFEHHQYAYVNVTEGHSATASRPTPPTRFSFIEPISHQPTRSTCKFSFGTIIAIFLKEIPKWYVYIHNFIRWWTRWDIWRFLFYHVPLSNSISNSIKHNDTSYSFIIYRTNFSSADEKHM